jgi:nucleoside-diphosphate-sugar epimerase
MSLSGRFHFRAGRAMNILITGITGRVGANIAKHFLGKGHGVRGLVWPGDRQAEKLQQTLKQVQGENRLEIVEGDLKSLADVKRAAEGQEVILHLGAAFQAGGPFTPEQYFDTNIKGVFSVCEAALGLGGRLKHLIFTSTDATYSKYPPDGLADPVINEANVPQGSTDWYAFSKIEGEHLVSRYVRHEKLRATVIRFPMVWGAGEVLEYGQFRLSYWLKAFQSRTDPEGAATYRALKKLDNGPALGGGRIAERLIIACDRSGRPWKKHCIEVRDIVHAYDRAIANEKTYGNTYQIAGPGPFTWDEVAPLLAKHLDLPVSRVNLAGVPPTYYEFDLSAAKRDFGFSPSVTMKETIEEAARYRREGGGELIPTKVGR